MMLIWSSELIIIIIMRHFDIIPSPPISTIHSIIVMSRSIIILFVCAVYLYLVNKAVDEMDGREKFGVADDVISGVAPN